MAWVSLIIPAAGTGRRFGDRENKIFKPIAGREIFLRALDAFAGRDDICQIQLVVSSRDLPEIRDRYSAELDALGVSLTPGGASRTQSVRNALANVQDKAELIAVHDAARPCVSRMLIDTVFAQACKTLSAIPAYPVHGTLKIVDADWIVRRTQLHEEFWEAQTPQVFAKDILLRAYSAGHQATDDAHLVEMLGVQVSVVMGDPRNIKITTPADLVLAEAVIGSLEARPHGDGA